MKKMILFFDTETTGVPMNYNAPLTDFENWPRLVQLAWQLYSIDGDLYSEISRIIYPDGFIIPNAVANIHRITTERAILEGFQLDFVLDVFSNYLLQLDILLVVGHNITFDVNIIKVEFLRCKMPDAFESKKLFDTMRFSTPLLKIPGSYGYKYPKLIELYRHLFHEDFEDAHNALSDVKATAKCFFEFQRLDILPKNLLT